MRLVCRFVTGFLLLAGLLALPRAARADGSIKVLRTVVYAEGAFVRPEVRSECRTGEQLPQYIQEYAHKNGIEVELVDELPPSGRVLQLEISDAIETGNAWTGRQKGLVIHGRLLEDGAELASFRARRMTAGGAFGGYKGTCSFFGRCAKALGHDVADWLRSPSKDAQIGG